MKIYTAACVVVGTLGLAFAVLPAKAQNYAYGPDYQGATAGGANEVVVISPHFHALTSPLNTPPENVSLSQPVSYADLDLRTWRGARELRTRVRVAAAQICDGLRQIYPYTLNPHEPCFRSVLSGAIPKADEAIADARIAARRSGYYGGYDYADYDR